MAEVPFLGCKISLISKCDIRYEGILYCVDAKESTIALSKVKSHGTEDRADPNSGSWVAPKNEVYDIIIFRASDVKDLRVDTPEPPGLSDPAIISAQQHLAPTAEHRSREQKRGPTEEPKSSNQDRRPEVDQSDNNTKNHNINNLKLNQMERRPNRDHSGIRNPDTRSNNLDRRSNRDQSGSRNPDTRSSNNNNNSERRSNRDLSSSNHTNGRKSTNERRGDRDSSNNQHHNKMRMNNNNSNMNSDRRPDRDSRRGPPMRDNRDSRDNRDNRDNRDRDNRSYRDRTRDSQSRRPPHHVMRRPRSGDRDRRGIGQGGGPRGPKKTPLKFEGDYDFDEANKHFLELEAKLKNLKLKSGDETKQANGQSKSNDADTTAKGLVGNSESGSGYDSEDSSPKNDDSNETGEFYDKTKSFFDKISCEASERNSGKVGKPNWRKERQLNAETFGVSANYRRGGYRGRVWGANSYNRR